jgi:ubiquinone/menaquinone biosynthesis C-methylase UbiE
MFRYVSKCKLVGADLDWDVVRKAEGKVGHLPGIMLNHADIYTLPYPDNTFDAAILSEVLEHLERDVDALREVLRVLKPGGVVAITVPNASYPFWWDPINKTLETVLHRHIGHPFAGSGRIMSGCMQDQLRNSVRPPDLLEDERAFTHTAFRSSTTLSMGLANRC